MARVCQTLRRVSLGNVRALDEHELAPDNGTATCENPSCILVPRDGLAASCTPRPAPYSLRREPTEWRSLFVGLISRSGPFEGCPLSLRVRLSRGRGALRRRAALAAPVARDHLEVELVAERDAVAPGGPCTSACASRTSRTGTRTGSIRATPASRRRLRWTLPDGVTAGDIEWPAPQRLPIGAADEFRLRRRDRAAGRRSRCAPDVAVGTTLPLLGERVVARLQGRVHSGRCDARRSSCPCARTAARRSPRTRRCSRRRAQRHRAATPAGRRRCAATAMRWS